MFRFVYVFLSPFCVGAWGFIGLLITGYKRRMQLRMPEHFVKPILILNTFKEADYHRWPLSLFGRLASPVQTCEKPIWRIWSTLESGGESAGGTGVNSI